MSKKLTVHRTSLSTCLIGIAILNFLIYVVSVVHGSVWSRDGNFEEKGHQSTKHLKCGYEE